MIIKYTDNTQIDSDKVCDLSAMILEKCNEIYEFCKKYDIPFLLKMVDKKTGEVDSSLFCRDRESYIRIINSLNLTLKNQHDGFEIVKNDNSL
jgi:hypothetical protein